MSKSQHSTHSHVSNSNCQNWCSISIGQQYQAWVETELWMAGNQHVFNNFRGFISWKSYFDLASVSLEILVWTGGWWQIYLFLFAAMSLNNKSWFCQCLKLPHQYFQPIAVWIFWVRTGMFCKIILKGDELKTLNWGRNFNCSSTSVVLMSTKKR